MRVPRLRFVFLLLVVGLCLSFQPLLVFADAPDQADLDTIMEAINDLTESTSDTFGELRESLDGLTKATNDEVTLIGENIEEIQTKLEAVKVDLSALTEGMTWAKVLLAGIFLLLLTAAIRPILAKPSAPQVVFAKPWTQADVATPPDVAATEKD